MDDTEEMENSNEAESFDDSGNDAPSENEEAESEEWTADNEASGFMEIFREMADDEGSNADTDWGMDLGGAVGFVKPLVKALDDMLYIGSKVMVTAVRFGYRMAKEQLREIARKKQFAEPEEDEDEVEEEEDPFPKDGENW